MRIYKVDGKEKRYSVFATIDMESRDDFYVYLNSTDNKDIFPYNKHNYFTNKIGSTIDLRNGTYEVGLVNIIYEPKFITISAGNEDYIIITSFAYSVNGDGKTMNVKYIPNSDICVNSSEQLIRTINDEYVAFLKSNDMISNDQYEIIFFNPLTNKVEFKQPIGPVGWKVIGTGFQFSGKMREVLGIKTMGNPMDMSTATYTRPIIPSQINSMFIYTDIVEPSYLGEQMVHLLDLLPLPHTTSKTGTLTIYKRVNKSVIDDISIRIGSSKNSGVPFTDEVTVNIILHFRKI